MELETHHNKGSSGVAKAGLATGVTALGVEALNLLGGGGILGNLFGGNCGHGGASALQAVIASKDSEISLLKSTIFTDQKSLEMYQYVDGRLRNIEAQIAAQAVSNQATKDSFAIAEERRACLEREVHEAIRRECEARKCSDNTIVNYVNATFYPKMTASVTTGTETVSAVVYNPLPINTCGC